MAREPAVRPAPVRVRVAADQTSDANVPKVVRLRDPKLQMVAGSEVIILPIEVDAFDTCVLVFELTPLTIPEVCVLVFRLMFAANEVDAFNTAVLVFELTAVVTAEV